MDSGVVLWGLGCVLGVTRSLSEWLIGEVVCVGVDVGGFVGSDGVVNVFWCGGVVGVGMCVMC
jgi:hypothetical protein